MFQHTSTWMHFFHLHVHRWVSSTQWRTDQWSLVVSSIDNVRKQTCARASGRWWPTLMCRQSQRSGRHAGGGDGFVLCFLTLVNGSTPLVSSGQCTPSTSLDHLYLSGHLHIHTTIHARCNNMRTIAHSQSFTWMCAVFNKCSLFKNVKYACLDRYFCIFPHNCLGNRCRVYSIINNSTVWNCNKDRWVEWASMCLAAFGLTK